MAVNSISLSIENTIYTTSEETQLSIYTGLSGWRWDHTRIQDDQTLSTFYDTTTGSYNGDIQEGTAFEDWISGTIDSISLAEISLIRLDNQLLFVPKYSTGIFSIGPEKYNLYSDFSYSNAINIGSPNQIELREDCKYDSIQCGIYKRNTEGTIYRETSFNYVETFTGKVIDGERIVTNIETPATYSDRHREYLIQDNILYLNGTYLKQVGFGNTRQDILRTWERFNDLVAGATLYLSYLQIDPDSIEVVALDIAERTNYTYKQTLSLSTSTDHHYTLDSDLGIIRFGGVTHNSIRLAEDVSTYETTLYVYRDEDFLLYPQQGILLLENEYIYYEAKGYSSFIGCTRGFQNTLATTHSKGQLLSVQQQGAIPTGNIYVKYKALPRIDYEITDYHIRTANKENWLNINPFTQIYSNKITQIAHTTKHIDSITLEIDEALIGGNLYGPVYYGTDVSRLTATAYDSHDSPVEDVLVYIELISGAGQLNNSSTLISDETNPEGQISCFYNSPYTNESTIEITDIVHQNGNTIFTVTGLSSAVENKDITLYQILKHDPFTGTVGKRVTVVDYGSTSEGNTYLDVRMVPDKDFNGGAYQILIESIKYTGLIINCLPVYSVDNELLTRIYLEETLIAIIGADLSTVILWLLEPEATEWNSISKNGVSVLVYEWSESYQHPITGNVGAYGPVVPTEHTRNKVIYTNRLLSLPAPANDKKNLGAYQIIAPSEVKFIAYAYDTYSGRRIESNIIRVKLTLPNTLQGVDSTGILPIPYGYSCISEDFNIGTAVGGNNFLTVNPIAKNQFNLRGLVQ